MINVTVSNNTKRERLIVTDDTTINEIFEQAGIDCSRGMVTLDGSPITNKLNESIGSFGVGASASLMSIIKNDNAL